MKNRTLHSVFSTIITLIVLLPFAIQTLHALEGHKHVYCNAKDEKHYHQKEIDCNFYHLKITYNSFDFSNTFSLHQPEFNFGLPTEYNRTYFYFFQSSKSSRAPPYFIV